MKIRIEFGPSKSSSYHWAVRLCKKLPGYKETIEEGMTIHTVEFEDIETFEQIQRCIGGRKNTAYYLNDRPVAVDILWGFYDKKHPPCGSLHPIQMRDSEGELRTDYVPAADIVDISAEPPRRDVLPRLGKPSEKGK
jgi:hypothetical protein